MTDTDTNQGHRADHLVGPAVRGAIETALWVGSRYDSTVEPPESEPDDLRGLWPVSAEIEAEVRQDVEGFVLGNADDCLAYVARKVAEGLHEGQGLEEYAAECIGHDFMLTRNGHGAGFWDRGYGDLGDRLTAASKPYGSFSLEADEHDVLSVQH